MRTSTTFLSAVTAAALVAGVGIAAAPAKAKVTSQVSGSTTITILPEVYVQLSVVGVQFQAFDPATSTNPSGTQALHFPVTKPVKARRASRARLRDFHRHRRVRPWLVEHRFNSEASSR